MTVEHEIVRHNVQHEVIPKLLDLKRQGAYFEALCSPSWVEIEKAWLEDPKRVNTLMQFFVDDVARTFADANRKVDAMFDKKDALRKHAPLADSLPDELLISQNEGPMQTTMPGIAFGLSRWGLNNITDGRVEQLITRKIRGSGNLIITGSGDDKKNDQIKLAYTLLRALNISEDILKHDYHFHLSGGQGPSAGLAMLMSMTSAHIGEVISSTMAFTGELCLTGRVKAVGGLLQKAIGAYRSRIETIVLPKGNERDIEELPKILRDGLSYKFIEEVEEVLIIALPK